MEPTSQPRRRTAGLTALFAALLLVLTTLFGITPASASGHTGTCKDLDGYGDVGNVVGNSSGDWGSIEHTADGPLTLDVNDGYTLRICLKKGSTNSGAGAVDTGPYEGPIVDRLIRYSDGDGLSHYSYRVVDRPTQDTATQVTPEAPAFVDPDCDTDAAVVLPGTSGVDYDYDSQDVVPGGTVVVIATPQAGHEFPEDATDTWEHTFPSVSDDCDVPTTVTPQQPTFTDPTCDATSTGLDVPADTDAVTYTVTGDQEPGGTVIVTATAAEGVVFADDTTTTTWEHTYAEVPTNCGGVGGSVADPAASVTVTCDGVNEIVLDNTGSDVVVTYTITGVDGYDTVDVPAGTTQTITDLGIDEDDDYDISVMADGMDDATAAGTHDCVTPTTTTTPPPAPDTTTTPSPATDTTTTPPPAPDTTTTPPPATGVLPDAVAQPGPGPVPAQPAVPTAAQSELPATGVGSTALLLLALLMLGLGTATLARSQPRRQH